MKPLIESVIRCSIRARSIYQMDIYIYTRMWERRTLKIRCSALDKSSLRKNDRLWKNVFIHHSCGARKRREIEKVVWQREWTFFLRVFQSVFFLGSSNLPLKPANFLMASLFFLLGAIAFEITIAYTISQRVFRSRKRTAAISPLSLYIRALL